MSREPEIVFCLIEQILATLRDSGATQEECRAAMRAAEAILPETSIRPKNTVVIRG